MSLKLFLIRDDCLEMIDHFYIIETMMIFDGKSHPYIDK